MIRRLAGIAALVLAIALVPAALAAKGGNGKGNGGGSSPSAAWVSASPDPASAGSQVDLKGCGYLVEPIQVRVINSNGDTQIYGAGVWNTGCFSGYFVATEAGTYTIEVWQLASKELHLKASTTLSVV
jgi:hypothetical protein